MVFVKSEPAAVHFVELIFHGLLLPPPLSRTRKGPFHWSAALFPVIIWGKALNHFPSNVFRGAFNTPLRTHLWKCYLGGGFIKSGNSWTHLCKILLGFWNDVKKSGNFWTHLWKLHLGNQKSSPLTTTRRTTLSVPWTAGFAADKKRQSAPLLPLLLL